jgi:hypothetical protein
MRKIVCSILSESSFRCAGLALLVAISLLAERAQAQTSEISADHVPLHQPPPGPLLNAAPIPGQWITTFSYPEGRDTRGLPATESVPSNIPEPAYLGKRPAKITTAKSRDIVQETIIDLKGNTIEQWYVGSTLYHKPPGEELWLQVSPGSGGVSSDRNYAPLPSSGFRDLGWIIAKNYAGITKYAGRSCLVFVLNPPANLSPSHQRITSGAWHKILSKRIGLAREW